MPRPRRPALLVSLFAVACAHGSPGSSDGPEAQAVVQTVDNMFAAMRAHDGAALGEQFVEGAIIVHLGERPDGSRRHRVVPATEFVESTSGAPQDLVEHFTSPPAIRIDGSMATVWGPYELLVDGERHHCGVNALQLGQIDGAWRVTAITYTARSCA